ncbi:MAG: hypothetical protein ACK56I_14435, partial [bacterium]
LIKLKLASIVKEVIVPRIVGDFSSEFMNNVEERRFGNDCLDASFDPRIINLGFETKSMTFTRENIQIILPYTCSSIAEQFKVDTVLATMAHTHKKECKAFLVRFSK